MHPEMRLAAVSSTSAPGKRLDEVLPAFRKQYDLTIESFDTAALRAKCDAVFVGVPSKESMPIVAALRAEGVRVLDLGGDFRLKDPALFARYYKAEHTATHLLGECVYGLPPLYRQSLGTAQLVSVPGCYPISVVLPLRPIVDHVATDVPVVVDSISGISGAGRTPSEGYHFPEMNENLKAYRLATHQHVPEIEQELGNKVMVQFSPHVAPLTRGILSTITFRPTGSVDPAALYQCYDAEPFVRVLPAGQLPEVRFVRASSYCDIGWVMDERTGNLIVVSAIDNLMGGTAGMAVQCFNLMFGFDETTGLTYGGMAP
jgi:N-acetyl-gamma-glutamyl-phosphate reductase